MAVPGIVAHLDLDAFFAAVEQLESPELRTMPLVVGGDPHGRGVVATANYVARGFGIHSAMSAAEALRRCPHAVFVRPRHALYREYSRHVWETVRGVVPTLEQTGIDEGYLDIGAAIAGGRAAGKRPRVRAAFSGPGGEVARDFLEARVVAEAVQTAVRGATSLTCSLGVASCKVVAKVASDMRKPGGLVVVSPGQEAAFLAPFDVRRLPGVGPKAEERLRRDGVTTVGALAALADGELARLLPGSVGAMLRRRARGIDPRPLELDVERISISVENTFERDLVDRERLHDELRGMAGEVASALQRRGQTARTVSAKLRYADFSIRSRSTSLAVGIDDADRIGALACRLLDRGLRDRPGALRLVGVGVSGLADYRQLALDAQ
jgi:DNA polymerase IV